MKKFLALLFIFSFAVAQSPTSIGEYVVSNKSHYNPPPLSGRRSFRRFTVHYLEDEFRLTGQMDSISEFYCDSIGSDIPHYGVTLYPKADGTKLLGVISDFSYNLYAGHTYRKPFLEFDMSIPYDFSTITLDSTDAGIPKVSSVYGDYNFHVVALSEIKISNDGKYLFVVREENFYGITPEIYAEVYELNTPWTFMDGVVDSTYQSRFQIFSDGATMTGDGKYIVVKGNQLENYRLTTPFDLDSRELIEVHYCEDMDGVPQNYSHFSPCKIQYHNDGEYFSFYRWTDSIYPNDFYFFRLETHGDIGTAKLISRSSPYHDHYYIPTDTSGNLDGNISPGFYSTTINPNNIEKQPLDTELSLEVFDSDSDLVDIVFYWNGVEEIDGWDVDTDYRSLDGWTYSNWTQTSSYQLNEGYSSRSDNEGENNTLAYIEKDIVLDYPGELSFDWEVRSEVGDTGRFILDDVTELEWTGLLDDEPDPYSGSYSLSAGTHAIRWEYEKDEGGPSTAGYDRLILSNIEVDYEMNIPTDTVYNVGMDSLVNGNFIDLDYGRNYTWLAEIMDGTDTTTTPDFTFKTKPQLYNNLPTTWNGSPDSNATGISVNPTLYIDINDQDNDTCIVTFFNGADSTIIGSDTVSHLPYYSAEASVTWSDLDYETEYTWYATVEDVRDTVYTSTYNFTTIGVVSLIDSLSHYYTLEADGTDTVGTADGENTGTDPIAYSSGIYGNCAHFDGDLDQDFKSFWTFSTPYTLSMWAYIDSLSGSAYLVWGHNSDNISVSFDLYGDQDLVYAHYTSAGLTGKIRFENIQDSTWYHLVFQWDGTTNSNSEKLFVNGVKVAEGAPIGATVPSGISAIHLGTSFYGKIDEVAVFNTELSSSVIQGVLYNGGDGWFPFAADTTTPTSVEYLIIPSGVSFEDLIKFYNLDIDSIQSRTGVDIRE